MQQEKHQRIYREFKSVVEASADTVFPLLCPTREYDWIPHWRCRLIHSTSGFAEPGCVFRTDFGDDWGEEVWVISHYQPNSTIAFVRTGPVRTTRYQITLTPAGQDSVTIAIRQEITALTARGNELLAAFSQKDYETTMVHLISMLEHYLKYGTMLRT